MPIYEFRCAACGEKFEDIVSSKVISISCPKCGSGETEKLVSAFSFKSSGADFSGTSSSKGCSTCTAKSCATCK